MFVGISSQSLSMTRNICFFFMNIFHFQYAEYDLSFYFANSGIRTGCIRQKFEFYVRRLQCEHFRTNSIHKSAKKFTRINYGMMVILLVATHSRCQLGIV